MNNIIDMEKDFAEKVLKDEIERLTNENTKLRILLKEADVDYNVADISDEEVICVEQIANLKNESKDRDLSTDEIKKFDLLVKNLKLIRGELKRGKKGGLKKISTADLKKQLNDN